MAYLSSLILTLLVELPIVTLFLVRRASVRFVLTAVLFGNLVSHPFIHLVPPAVFPSYRWSLVAREGAAIAIEAAALVLIARPQPWWLCVLASLVANLASFLLGALVAGLTL